MYVVYVVLVGSAFFFGGAAILALVWAFRNGQMQNFSRGATSIFDPDEPLGEVTDRALEAKSRTEDRHSPGSEND